MTPKSKKRLYLSESALSEVFWTRLFASSDLPKARADAELIMRETKIIHQKFPQNMAGSISLNSTTTLWLIAKYFEPNHIFEIGTFIGRSCLAMLAGAAGSLHRIDTCDFSLINFFY